MPEENSSTAAILTQSDLRWICTKQIICLLGSLTHELNHRSNRKLVPSFLQ